jgi:hypothetical protein
MHPVTEKNWLFRTGCGTMAEGRRAAMTGLAVSAEDFIVSEGKTDDNAAKNLYFSLSCQER